MRAFLRALPSWAPDAAMILAVAIWVIVAAYSLIVGSVPSGLVAFAVAPSALLLVLLMSARLEEACALSAYPRWKVATRTRPTEVDSRRAQRSGISRKYQTVSRDIEHVV